MIYQPGQKVWVKRLEWLPGVIVAQLPIPCPLSGGGALYEVEIPEDGVLKIVGDPTAKNCSCSCFLRPRKDDDGRELVPWSECVWRPQEIAGA